MVVVKVIIELDLLGLVVVVVVLGWPGDAAFACVELNLRFKGKERKGGSDNV